MSGEAVHTTKSESFWLDDGDIVLSTKEDGSLTLFRVHRALLAIESPVFRDMLSIGQSSGDESSPVLLAQDTEQEVTSLLGALYLGRPPQELTFDAALGILRLSHKYQIEGLEHNIKRRLLEDWPIKRSDYLERLKHFGDPPAFRVSQAIKLIKTASLCDAKELLPTAFYEVAAASTTHLKEITESLPPADVIRVYAGRSLSLERLKVLANNDHAKSQPLMWNSNPPDSIWVRRDLGSKPCMIVGTEHIWKMFTLLRTDLASCIFEGDFSLVALRKIDRLQFNLGCPHCSTWFVDILSNKEQEIWENISVDFNLPRIDPEMYSKSIFCLLDNQQERDLRSSVVKEKRVIHFFDNPREGDIHAQVGEAWDG